MSYWLRMTLNPHAFWIQFIPTLLACTVYAANRIRQGTRWNWPHELPRIVWFCAITTPYGGWIFDLAILLVPVLAAAVQVVQAQRWLRGGILFALLLVILAASNIWVFGLHEFWWVSPAVLVVWMLAVALGRQPDDSASWPFMEERSRDHVL